MDSADIWWRNGVIYQVYPRSFADSNHDGIGDLNGILEKLDYVKDLGADAIWLSPIFPSPNIDFGYDISDYQSIDPLFGSMQVFNQLVSEAHSRGIRIILDLVLNHSSDQHPWFQESRSSRDNPYRDWYIWQDAKPGNTPPNNWRSWFGGGGWEYDSITGQYYYHGFYKEQPDLNWRKPQMRRAMLDVFSFWLDHGVDGFRLDVFNQYFKDSAFRDNPHKLGLRMFDQQKHIYDTNQPEMIPLLQEIRRLTDQYDERYIIGETFFSTLETAASYCVPGLLHGTFQFGLISRRWNPGVYLKNIQQWEKVLSPESWPSQVMNNHDTQRSASRFGQGEDDERLKVAAALLLTLRGTPFIYYGEEIGMRDIPITRNAIQDRVGKRYWPLYIGRDGCRSPMQWDNTPNAGFSQTKPWLPVHRDFLSRNVTQQKQDPDSLLNFYKNLIQLRKKYPALIQGMFLPLTDEPKKVLAYLRKDNQQTILVGLNFSGKPVKLVLGRHLADTNWHLLLSNKRSALDTSQYGFLPLEGNEACILLQK